jgi:hypothetical protein
MSEELFWFVSEVARRGGCGCDGVASGICGEGWCGRAFGAVLGFGIFSGVMPEHPRKSRVVYAE